MVSGAALAPCWTTLPFPGSDACEIAAPLVQDWIRTRSWKLVLRRRPPAVVVPKQTYVTRHRHIANQLEHGSISAKTAPWKSYPTRSHDMLTTRRNSCDDISHKNLKKHNRNRKDTVESKLCKSAVKCQTNRARQEQSRTPQRKSRPC